MWRTISISIVFACLASTYYGQLVVEPSLNCTEAKVGYTFPSELGPLYYTVCMNQFTPMTFPCPYGSGYINNGTLEGCVPWVLWECTNKDGKPACDASQQASRFPALQPDTTWVCQGINIAEEVPCLNGSAFVPNDPNIGCKPWSVWSQYCPY